MDKTCSTMDSMTKPLQLSWSGHLCLAYSVFTSACLVHAFVSTDIGPRWDQPDPEEIWHARTAVLLVFSSVVAEMCFLSSSMLTVKEIGWNVSSKLRLHGTGDSWLTLAEYSTKICCSAYLWYQQGGVVHTDVQAFGGSRPVYLGRFAQWSVAVPILVLITNRGLLSNRTDKEVLARSAPSLLAAFVYVWTAWFMEVTTGAILRWVLFILSMFGHIVVSIDQVKIAADTWGEGEAFGLKGGMLMYQLTSFTLYSVVFVMGRFGVISSLAEQVIYAYCDATIKVFQGAILAMVRNREDLGMIRRWWLKALAATQVIEDVVRKARLPVFALDTEARITSWNQNLQLLTGLTFDDVKNKHLRDIVCVQSKESCDLVLEHVKSSAQHDGINKVNSQPDKAVARTEPGTSVVEMGIPIAGAKRGDSEQLTVRQLAMTFVCLLGDTGECTGFMAIGQDLSELSELRFTQEKKSTLMGMLSHELRSPLHGMVGLAGALLEGESGKPMQRQLSMIRGCAARLLDLVNNIMDLAQIEKRKRDDKPKERPTSPVDMASIVDEVITMTEAAVDKTNKPLLRSSVRLVNNVACKQVPLIPGDPYKLTQVVYNLMTNACKFTDRGTVSISCRHLPESQCLEIDVTDTGRGISKEAQKRIFRPFEQEQNGDARNFQGVGLGLAVCTEIAEIHGGELRVASQVGQGSTFTMSLFCDGSMGFSQTYDSKADQNSEPLPSIVQPVQPNKPTETQVTRILAAREGKPLVLSVDDDQVNQEVMRNFLSEQYEVHCVMDGHQALKFLESRKQDQLDLPDVVLLDIQMPGMNGFEVCEEIRKTFEHAHAKLPIIMVSARAPQHQTALQSYETGTTDFLAKPFDAEILRCKVKVAVSMRQEGLPSDGMSIVVKEAVVKEAAVRSKAIEEKLDDAEKTIEQLQKKLDEQLQEHSSLNKQSTATQEISEQLRKELRKEQESNAHLHEKTAQLQHQLEELKHEHDKTMQTARLAEKLQEQVKSLEQDKEEWACSVSRARTGTSTELADTQAKPVDNQQMQARIQQLEELVQQKQQQQQQQQQRQRHGTETTKREECHHQRQQLGTQSSKRGEDHHTHQLQAQVRQLQHQLQLAYDALQALSAVVPSQSQVSPHGKVMPTCSQDYTSDHVQSPTSSQETLVSKLRKELICAKATIKILSTRIEMVNKVANGCHELLALPTAIPPLVKAGIFRDADQPQQESYQLNDYKMVGEILSSQLELIEQISIQSSNLGMLMFCRESAATAHPDESFSVAAPDMVPQNASRLYGA